MRPNQERMLRLVEHGRVLSKELERVVDGAVGDCQQLGCMRWYETRALTQRHDSVACDASVQLGHRNDIFIIHTGTVSWYLVPSEPATDSGGPWMKRGRQDGPGWRHGSSCSPAATLMLDGIAQ